MKKILGLTIALFLIISMAGIGTWAYMSDVEASAGNTFAAGILDLKTNDIDGVSQTLLAVNMQPGDTIGPEYITLKNAGTVAGSNLTIAFTYVENDASANPVNKSADETGDVIEVITLKYDGFSLLASVSDNNSNGYPDIQDLKNTDLSGLNGINALASKAFEIVVKSRDVMNNDFQADGINITMTFTLNQ